MIIEYYPMVVKKLLAKEIYSDFNTHIYLYTLYIFMMLFPPLNTVCNQNPTFYSFYSVTSSSTRRKEKKIDAIGGVRWKD